MYTNLSKRIFENFRTFSGIRQGLASSALLFIAFVDDLIDYLEEKCPIEPILQTLHCLLHADDTAIIGTNRELFIQKCNRMLQYFSDNSLSLNFSKSGYIIIDPTGTENKTRIILDNGILKYKSVITYLGAKISDSGLVAMSTSILQTNAVMYRLNS